LWSRDDLLRVITAQARQSAEVTATGAAVRAAGRRLSREALHRIDTAEK
jgi:hypothetical protein